MKAYMLPILLLFTMFFEYPDFIQEDEDNITTIVLVRHAEKMDQTDNPELSQEGIERSLRLRDMLVYSSIDAVYSTPYIRTEETVKPVAEYFDLHVTPYQAIPDSQWANSLVSNHRGEVVLISGHSNTVPELANLLLQKTHFEADFDESDYGNILIITITEASRKLLHLRY